MSPLPGCKLRYCCCLWIECYSRVGYSITRVRLSLIDNLGYFRLGGFNPILDVVFKKITVSWTYPLRLLTSQAMCFCFITLGIISKLSTGFKWVTEVLNWAWRKQRWATAPWFGEIDTDGTLLRLPGVHHCNVVFINAVRRTAQGKDLSIFRWYLIFWAGYFEVEKFVKDEAMKGKAGWLSRGSGLIWKIYGESAE